MGTIIWVVRDSSVARKGCGLPLMIGVFPLWDLGIREYNESEEMQN